MTTTTYVIIFAGFYLIFCYGLSFYANKQKAKGGAIKDFYVASNSLGSFVIFMTSMATAFSAFAFMGQLGQVYNFGSSAILNFMSYGILSYPLFLLLGKRFWYFGKKYGYVTPADFVAHRYQSNGPSRILVGLIIGVYFSIFYIVIQMQGCSWAIMETTGLPPKVSALIIAVILATYVSIGGIRGAAYVDVMQAGFLLFGSLVIAFTVTIKNGGLAPLFTAMEAAKPGALIPKQGIVPLLTGSLVMALSMPIWPSLWVKYYSAKSLRTTYNVATGCGLGTVIVTVSMPLIIVAGLIIAYPTWDASKADALVIRYVLDYTHPLIAAIILGGLVSAAMSTAAGLLLLISSIFSNDLPAILPKEKRSAISEKQLLLLGKVVVFIVIGICYFITLQPLGQLVTMGISLAYPGYLLALPVVIGGLFWRRANKQGMIASLICGLVAIYYTTFVNRAPMGVASGIWGLAACSVVFVAVCLMTQPTDTSVLAEFGLAEKSE